MRHRKPVLRISSLLAVFISVLGCSGVDKVGRKMDIASEYLTTGKPTYEGKLISRQAVGAMVSLQFVDGQIYEVTDAPSALRAGDIIRIYKTDKGYIAHLWQASKDPIIPPAGKHSAKS